MDQETRKYFLEIIEKFDEVSDRFDTVEDSIDRNRKAVFENRYLIQRILNEDYVKQRDLRKFSEVNGLELVIN